MPKRGLGHKCPQQPSVPPRVSGYIQTAEEYSAGKRNEAWVHALNLEHTTLPKSSGQQKLTEHTIPFIGKVQNVQLHAHRE